MATLIWLITVAFAQRDPFEETITLKKFETC